jgi:mono/diheme cytochrome c family protein
MKKLLVEIMKIKTSRTKSGVFFILLIAILAFGCRDQTEKGAANGTAWGSGSFKSNGKRIYFTSTSDRETPITYTGGPIMGRMMMGGRLACASCHGTDARGGRHRMHMEIMDAPDIRWTALTSDQHEEGHAETATQEHHDKYDFEDFKNSVEKGEHPDGDELDDDMPRWKMSDDDLKDLMNYLKSL